MNDLDCSDNEEEDDDDGDIDDDDNDNFFLFWITFLDFNANRFQAFI